MVAYVSSFFVAMLFVCLISCLYHLIPDQMKSFYQKMKKMKQKGYEFLLFLGLGEPRKKTKVQNNKKTKS